MSGGPPLIDAIVIEPGRSAPLSELWRARGVVAQLAARDLILRYRQTAMGVAWSLLRPALTATILTVVFSRVAQLPSDGSPYAALVLAALIPWTLVASALIEGSASVVSYPTLVTKVYIPRLAMPLAALAVAAVDAAVVVVLLAAVLAWHGIVPPARVVALPLLALPAVAAAIGAALWGAALTVRWRDVRHVVPFVVQMGLYASPVGFATMAVVEPWRGWLALNPVAAAIDGVRWCALPGASAPDWNAYALSSALALALMASGIAWFRRAERGFADAI